MTKPAELGLISFLLITAIKDAKKVIKHPKNLKNLRFCLMK